MQMTESFSAGPPTSTRIASDCATDSSEGSWGGRMMGLLLVAAVPALFWTALLALIAPLTGYMPSPATLLAVAIGIGAFLLAVCSALTSPAR